MIRRSLLKRELETKEKFVLENKLKNSNPKHCACKKTANPGKWSEQRVGPIGVVLA